MPAIDADVAARSPAISAAASDCEINGLDTTADIGQYFCPSSSEKKKENATTFSEPPP
jgi:hypothetical protein